jgi:hypothetical protein
MLWMLALLFVALVLASTVVLYVAYPHRGETVPHVPWLGDAMRKTVEALPTIENERSKAAQHR